MILSFIGPSGCGKDTQVSLLSNVLQVENISSGELLRELYSNGDEDGIKAAKYWQKGEWVPDEIIMKIIRKRLELINPTSVAILNGFPRTVNQAVDYDELMNAELEISKVVFFELDDELAIQRLSNRRICPNCEKIYHLIYNPSKLGEKCEECKLDLIQRKDDQEKIILERLRFFNKTTAPILQYYKKKGRLIIIDASRDIETIHKNLIKELDIHAK